jgi:hypothetical protein
MKTFVKAAGLLTAPPDRTVRGVNMETGARRLRLRRRFRRGRVFFTRLSRARAGGGGGRP